MPLCYLDFEQIQLWIVVLEANDKAFLEQHSKKEYVHGIFYEQYYKQPFFQQGLPKTKANRLDLDKDMKTKLLRAKAVTHGLNFKRGHKSLAQEYNIAEAEAKAMKDKYFKEHHWIEEWHQKVAFEVQKKGYLRNRFNTIRQYPVADNSMYNFLAQSTEASILKRALLRCFAYLTPPSRILLPNHDALLIQAPWSSAKKDFLECKRLMEEPIKEYKDFVFTVELNCGNNWGELISCTPETIEGTLDELCKAKATNCCTSSQTSDELSQR